MLGEILKPKDLIEGKRKGEDIKVHPTFTSLRIEELLGELIRLREEVEKIKRALERHGIEVE